MMCFTNLMLLVSMGGIMKNKLVSLDDVVKLRDNSDLSDSYVKYMCGLDKDHRYHHQEILDICALIDCISVAKDKYKGYIYSYVVPQLNKEFDLIKISKTACLNIELKSQIVPKDRIEHQLKQNYHYLKLLNRELHLFTFVSSMKKVYMLNENQKLEESSIENLSAYINSFSEYEFIDLDKIFEPSKILVSPLNTPDKFLVGDYILTQHQENIKIDILTRIDTGAQDHFLGITGGPGTGKTLLVYDLAKELSQKMKVLVVHSGILCEGHNKLNRKLQNVTIISAKQLNNYKLEEENIDIVIIDEAQRLYESSLGKVETWVKEKDTFCIFSYDPEQRLSQSEFRSDTTDEIEAIIKGNSFKLTNKIRTNKEMALFIKCLFNLSNFREGYRFPNVKIIYEPNPTKAMKRAIEISHEGYQYISFTGSNYDLSLNYQETDTNTHKVIGQEYDGVCMLLDYNWKYDGNKLKGNVHPNPNYLFSRLLYQGLTRVRKKLVLVVCPESVLNGLLLLLQNN